MVNSMEEFQISRLDIVQKPSSLTWDELSLSLSLLLVGSWRLSRK
jgi:hypothetical protein